MPGIFESRHDHYLIRILTFVRGMHYQNLVLLDSTQIQVTLEIHAVSLIDKIRHDGTVHTHCFSHVSQLEIGIEVWLFLGQIVFKRSLV